MVLRRTGRRCLFQSVIDIERIARKDTGRILALGLLFTYSQYLYVNRQQHNLIILSLDFILSVKFSVKLYRSTVEHFAR